MNDTIRQATAAQRHGDRERTRARQAGIAQLFSEGADMAPGVLALQKALIAGFFQSQIREADRLEKRGAPKARVAALRARIDRIEALRGELREAETGVKRVVESLGEPGMFHGYVRLPSGAPAIGYSVRLTGAGATRGRKILTAKTDESGYFRIEVEAASRVKPNTEEAKASTAAASSSTPKTAVDILDPARRVVFRDPEPPSFAAGSPPAFRFYPLLGKAFSGTAEDIRASATNPKTASAAGSNTEAATTKSAKPAAAKSRTTEGPAPTPRKS